MPSLLCFCSVLAKPDLVATVHADVSMDGSHRPDTDAIVSDHPPTWAVWTIGHLLSFQTLVRRVLPVGALSEQSCL